MFMKQDLFNDEREGKISSAIENLLISKPPQISSDEIEEFQNDNTGGSNSNRAKLLEQQRDILLRKDQERITSGVARSTAAKQFSSPRSTDNDNESSRFSGASEDGRNKYGGPPRGRRDEQDRMCSPTTGRGSGRPRGGRGGTFDDEYDNYDDRNRGRRKPLGPGFRDHDDDERERPPLRDLDRDRERDRPRDRSGERGEPRYRGGPGGRPRNSYDDDDYDRPKSGGGRRAPPRGSRDFDDDERDHRPGGRGGPGGFGNPGGRSGRGGRDDDYDNRRGPPRRGDELSVGERKERSRSPNISSDEEIADIEASHDSDGRGSHVVEADKSGERMFEARSDEERKVKLDLSDMKNFLTKPVPKGAGIVHCYIERNKSGANKIFPEYCLYLKEGDRFLLTGKKRTYNKTSNYLISMQRGDLSRESNNYIGKLRSNFIGTEFNIYDGGLNPKDCDSETLNLHQTKIRQELGICVYASNVLGSRGPRKMKVCVPRVRDDGSRVVWRPLNKDEEMVVKCKEQDHTNLTYLINKPPRWNEQVGAYVLNFNGRVTMASVKNFQLVTPEDQETVVLQFGRVGKDLFTMDFRFPLCPFQAFAVTLSSFDSKLACE